jgi:hypothetical protein
MLHASGFKLCQKRLNAPQQLRHSAALLRIVQSCAGQQLRQVAKQMLVWHAVQVWRQRRAVHLQLAEHHVDVRVMLMAKQLVNKECSLVNIGLQARATDWQALVFACVSHIQISLPGRGASVCLT